LKSKAKIILMTMLTTFACYWQVLGSEIVMADQIEDGYAQFPNELANRQKRGNTVGVQVKTDKRSYRSGEQIFVTLDNELPIAIYAPPEDYAHCSLVRVQKLTFGEWVDQGVCEPGDSSSDICLYPNSEMTGILFHASRHTDIKGPFWGRPSESRAVDGDLRDLPTVKPPKPSEPLREVQQARRPTIKHIDSAIKGDLKPGTYRLVFSFKVGRTSSQIETVYSQIFFVDG
jgi:hypothetical protein